MREILKALLKYKFQIIIIIVLLFMQAYCDLSLPNYTSDIVNIGIQNSGIDSVIPFVMSKSEYEKVLINSNESVSIKDAYTYYLDNEYSYNDGIYILTGELEESEIIYPLLKTYMDSINVDSTIEELKNKYENNEYLVENILVNFIKEDYERVGVNLKDLQMNYIYKVGFKMILIALSAMGLTIITAYLSSKVASGYSRDLRNKMMDKAVDLEPSDLSKFSTASLITRCTNDIVQVQSVLTIFLRIIIYAPILGIGASIKVHSSPLAWVIVLSVVLIMLLMFILFLVVVPKFKKFQDLLDRLNLVSRETLTGLSVVRAFASEKQEEKRFDEASKNLTKNGLFVGRAMAMLEPALTFMMNAVAVLIIFVGSKEVDNFSMGVGDLIAFITYTMQIIMSFLMLSIVAIMSPRALISIKRISEVFKSKKSIIEKEKPLHFSNNDYVEFKDVYFRYPNANEDVLRNISFVAKKGSTTAFIGSTGSGKSTLINLIPRFYDVTSGKIIINDVDIKDVSLKELRDKIGYIPQKGKLFKGTLLSNIGYGQKKFNKDKIKEAARVAMVEEFMDTEGLESAVSEKGSNYSGGQKQRIAIARALSTDSDILIFDDSFSSLDFKTDSLIRKELKKIISDKIVFVVAQRVSTVMNADNIIVLDEGEIAGIGKHKDLIKTCDIYKEIVESQMGDIR